MRVIITVRSAIACRYEHPSSCGSSCILTSSDEVRTREAILRLERAPAKPPPRLLIYFRHVIQPFDVRAFARNALRVGHDTKRSPRHRHDRARVAVDRHVLAERARDAVE